jgi:protoporphyrinogen IX oxidase
LAFAFGLALIWIDATQVRGGWNFLLQPWMIVKLAGVVFLGAWHGMLSRSFKRFEKGERPRTAKYWRATNEIPFLVAIVMVLAVTLEFGF